MQNIIKRVCKKWGLSGILLACTFHVLTAGPITGNKLAGCYLLHYSEEDLRPSVERSFEGFVRGSPGGYGIWSSYMEVRDIGLGENFEFIFFKNEKIDSISRIEKNRNSIKTNPDGIEFVSYCGDSSMGVIDRTTDRIKITIVDDGDLIVTIASERDTRSLWIFGGVQKSMYVMKMTRLPKPCDLPIGIETVRVLDVPGGKAN